MTEATEFETRINDLVKTYADKGLLFWCRLGDRTDRWLEVWPLMWGRATLQVVQPADGCEPFNSPVSVLDQWEYDTQGAAMSAAVSWDGGTEEPDGWTRHPETGRRRPDGDASKEYVRR
jgi:hypothetical protein